MKKLETKQTVLLKHHLQQLKLPQFEQECQTDGSGLGSLDASPPHFGGDRRELPAAAARKRIKT